MQFVAYKSLSNVVAVRVLCARELHLFRLHIKSNAKPNKPHAQMLCSTNVLLIEREIGRAKTRAKSMQVRLLVSKFGQMLYSVIRKRSSPL